MLLSVVANPARRRWRMVLAVLVVLAFGSLWVALGRSVTVDDLRQITRSAATTTQARPGLIFTLLTVAQLVGMVFSLPSKALLTVLAGALLGPVWGTACTLCGVLLGTSALFFGARRLFRQRFTERLGERIRRVQERLARRPVRAVAGLRMVITLPYGVITVAAALSSISYRHFILGSVLGDFPVVVLYTLGGERLASLNSISEALSPLTVAILLGVGLSLFVGPLLRWRRARHG